MSGRGDPMSMGFCGNRLVRSGEARGEETLSQALAHPHARIYLMQGGQWLVRAPDGRVDAAFAPFEADALGGALGEAVLLGWRPDTGAPRLALALPPGEEAHEVDLADLRALATEGRLDAETEGELAQAQHLLQWHARARFCGSCGAPTRAEIAGFRRRCAGCGTEHFPRTDPVVIMLIHDGAGRCLLGRQRHFRPGMWSCLAGFVEAGETLEDAVRRETMEETGVPVGEVVYHSSQPWPFPGSLMIGCTARAQAIAITRQEDELEDCRWFDAGEVRAMLEETHAEGLSVPNSFAIAHHLARHFADTGG